MPKVHQVGVAPGALSVFFSNPVSSISLPILGSSVMALLQEIDHRMERFWFSCH